MVDELCNMIKRGCSLGEFKKACQELMSQQDSQQEEKKDDGGLGLRMGLGEPTEIDNEFFSTIGTQGWSVLHSACSHNNTEIVEYLISKRRVNPNLKGKDNWSPLEIAVQSGFFQLTNLLLEDKKTIVNQINSEARGTALHIAAKSGYLPIC